MGLIQAIVAAPRLRAFAPAALSRAAGDYPAFEPDLGFSWDTGTAAEADGAAVYLVCTQSGVTPGGEPVFSRAFASDDGGLALSEDGYLINSDGHFLLGMPLDEDGRPESPEPEIVRVDAKGAEPAATSRIRYRANLASFPMTANADFEVPGSELLDKTLFARDPTAQGSGAILGDDRMKFIDRSVSGGSVAVFTGSGAAVPIALRWAKIGSLRNAGRDVWNLFYRLRRDARAGEAAWKNIGQNFIFAVDGRLEEGAQVVPILDMIVDGVRLGNITLAFGPGGITQFADRSGLVKVLEASADGCRGGAFTGISMSSRGRLFAHYEGSPMRPVADIHFTGEEPWFETGAVHAGEAVRRAA
jgi:flagellar hook protein FlgE